MSKESYSPPGKESFFRNPLGWAKEKFRKKENSRFFHTNISNFLFFSPDAMCLMKSLSLGEDKSFDELVKIDKENKLELKETASRISSIGVLVGTTLFIHSLTNRNLVETLAGGTMTALFGAFGILGRYAVEKRIEENEQALKFLEEEYLKARIGAGYTPITVTLTKTLRPSGSLEFKERLQDIFLDAHYLSLADQPTVHDILWKETSNFWGGHKTELLAAQTRINPFNVLSFPFYDPLSFSTRLTSSIH